MIKKIHKAQRRVEEIRKEMLTIGPMRPGRLSPQKRKNAKGKYYGSYWQISYTFDGKSHSHYVPEELVPQIKQQTDEYRRFKELTEKWIKLELLQAQFFLDQAKIRLKE